MKDLNFNGERKTMKMLQRYIGDQMVVCEVEQINAEGKGRWFGV